MNVAGRALCELDLTQLPCCSLSGWPEQSTEPPESSPPSRPCNIHNTHLCTIPGWNTSDNNVCESALNDKQDIITTHSIISLPVKGGEVRCRWSLGTGAGKSMFFSAVPSSRKSQR